MGCPSINAPLQTLVGSATWLVPGYGGSQTYLFCYANVYVSSGESSPAGSRNMTVQYNYTAPMLQSIVRPDGAYWGFVYDAANSSIASSTGYGDLIELIYPEGGTINYTWTFNKQASCLLSAFLGPGPRAIQPGPSIRMPFQDSGITHILPLPREILLLQLKIRTATR